MPAKLTAVVLTAVLVAYFVLLADRAVLLLGTGRPAGVGLGAAVLVLPLVGAWVAAANLRFGVRVERLTRRLAAEDGLPDLSGLPRRPSGRIDRTAADAWFDQQRQVVREHPADWRGWYRLARGYDIAGDRRRARDAMRHALRLADHALRADRAGHGDRAGPAGQPAGSANVSANVPDSRISRSG